MSNHSNAQPSDSPQKKSLAEKLHNDRHIYLAFGFIDGLSNVYNTLKYAFDVFLNSPNAANDLHLWLMSPIGIAVAVVEGVFLTLFSLLGSYFEDKNDRRFSSYLARFWPFVRDGIKWVKNAYKSTRTILFMAIIFGASAAFCSSIILPIGICLGLLSLFTKLWNRNMCNNRKRGQRLNNAVEEWGRSTSTKRQRLLQKNPYLKDVIRKCLESPPLEEAELIKCDLTDHTLIFAQICQQTFKQRLFAYLSAFAFGIMNGLYLYAGVYVLCLLTPPLALMITAFSIFFTLASIFREVYEEYTYQLKLELSALDAKLQFLPYNEDPAPLLARKEAITRAGYGAALGESLRSGLSVYSAITGLLFAASCFTVIPLACLLAGIGLGVVGLFGFSGYHFYTTRQAIQKKIPLSENIYPDFLEIFRSVASGARQSFKIHNGLLLNSVNDSTVIVIVTTISAVLQSILYAGKALAKGFGSPYKTAIKNPTMLPSNSAAELARLGEPSPSSSPTATEPVGFPPTQSLNPKGHTTADLTQHRYTS